MPVTYQVKTFDATYSVNANSVLLCNRSNETAYLNYSEAVTFLNEVEVLNQDEVSQLILDWIVFYNTL